MRSNEDIIREILRSDELAGDILRVLTLFNGVLWQREIRWEVEAMNSTLRRTLDINRIDDKIHLLTEAGLINLEKRPYSTISGEIYEDNLVRLTNMELVLNIMLNDKKLREYIKIRYEIYKQRK